MSDHGCTRYVHVETLPHKSRVTVWRRPKISPLFQRPAVHSVHCSAAQCPPSCCGAGPNRSLVRSRASTPSTSPPPVAPPDIANRFFLLFFRNNPPHSSLPSAHTSPGCAPPRLLWTIIDTPKPGPGFPICSLFL